MNSQVQIFVVEDKYIYSYGLEAMLKEDANLKSNAFHPEKKALRCWMKISLRPKLHLFLRRCRHGRFVGE